MSECKGYQPLREAIAAHITVRMLINSGDPVWVEDRGYPPARGAFIGSGAEIVPVPIDKERLVVEAGTAIYQP